MVDEKVKFKKSEKSVKRDIFPNGSFSALHTITILILYCIFFSLYKWISDFLFYFKGLLVLKGYKEEVCFYFFILLRNIHTRKKKKWF